MPVANSTFALRKAESDTRKYCLETHTLTVGGPLLVEYLSTGAMNNAAIMAARVPLLNETLADQEVRNIVFGLATVVSNENSAAQRTARIRAFIASYSGVDLSQLVSRVMDLLDAGQLLDADMRTAFGLTQNQWNNVKSQMTTIRTNWIAVSTLAPF
jgi:hypothetical protein